MNHHVTDHEYHLIKFSPHALSRRGHSPHSDRRFLLHRFVFPHHPLCPQRGAGPCFPPTIRHRLFFFLWEVPLKGEIALFNQFSLSHREGHSLLSPIHFFWGSPGVFSFVWWFYMAFLVPQDWPSFQGRFFQGS